MTTPTAARPRPSSRTERVEGLVLVAILLLVAGFAGAASFTHVHDWTMHNTPPGTPGWFGWANAVISELVPVAALLTIRRRRRHGQPIGYPLALLIAAAGLSLAAQLAVAKPGPSGWLLSAVPALAFMALVKLVLAPTPTVADSTAGTAEAEDTAIDDNVATSAERITSQEPPVTPAAVDPESVPTAAAPPLPEAPAHLLPTARFALVQHEQTTGRAITVDELAARMSVASSVAGQLLTAIRGTHPTPVAINGHAPVLGGAR